MLLKVIGTSSHALFRNWENRYWRPVSLLHLLLILGLQYGKSHHVAFQRRLKAIWCWTAIEKPDSYSPRQRNKRLNSSGSCLKASVSSWTASICVSPPPWLLMGPHLSLEGRVPCCLKISLLYGFCQLSYSCFACPITLGLACSSASGTLRVEQYQHLASDERPHAYGSWEMLTGRVVTARISTSLSPRGLAECQGCLAGMKKNKSPDELFFSKCDYCA